MSNESYDRYHPNRSCTYPRYETAAKPESPNQWGPRGWKVFHQTTFGYRAGIDEQCYYQFYYQDFLSYIKCSTCLEHYVDAIQRVPIRLYTAEDLFAWTVEIHNMVNRRTHKPILSLCEAQRIWFPQSTSCQTYPRNTTIYFS